MTDLLNCPFCGGEASAEMSVRADTYGCWIAGCDNEQCAPQPYTLGGDKGASIAAWNRRPHAPVSRPGDGVEGGWDRDLERGASAFIATSFGFSGPNDQDTPLQAAAREVGWMLSEVVDRIEWNKRGQAASALGRLATSIDGLVWPWEGDDPRHDRIRHSWRSFADNSADDDGRIDLTDVETCVAIGVMKAFQLLSPTLTPPAEPVSRPAGEGEREAVALADLRTIKSWLDGLSTNPDLNDVVADGGVTVGMCYQQEAREFAGRIDRALSLLRPGAPYAGGGEDLAGKLKAIRDKFLFPTPDKDHTDYAVMTRCIAALQPGGER